MYEAACCPRVPTATPKLCFVQHPVEPYWKTGHTVPWEAGWLSWALCGVVSCFPLPFREENKYPVIQL